MKHLVAAVFGLLLLQAPTSQAAIIIDTAQIGSDVVFSFSGTFDISRLTNIGSINDNELVVPNNGGILFFGTGLLDGYEMSDKLPDFGTTSGTFGSATGSIFKMYTNTPTVLGFASGYAGELITGSLSIVDSTFITLGLFAGLYKTTASNGDFVQLNIPNATSTVPIPAALPLFAAGLSAMGFMGWRRKRRFEAASAPSLSAASLSSSHN